MDKEKLVASIMADAEKDGEPLTRKEAEEVAEMELKAKTSRHYEQSKIKKDRVSKVRKVDKEKKHLLSCVQTLLEGLGANIQEVKTETEIDFYYNNISYTFKLTKHKPPKS